VIGKKMAKEEHARIVQDYVSEKELRSSQCRVTLTSDDSSETTATATSVTYKRFTKERTFRLYKTPVMAKPKAKINREQTK
jgi:hypothetical protein